MTEARANLVHALGMVLEDATHQIGTPKRRKPAGATTETILLALPA